MEKINDALAIFVFNAIWQMIIIGLAALLAERIVRKLPMRFQYNLWTVSLVLCLAVPGFSIFYDNIYRTSVSSPVVSRTIGKSLESGWLEQIPAFFFFYQNIFLAAFALFLLSRIVVLFGKWRNTKQIYSDASGENPPLKIAEIFRQCRQTFGVEKVQLVFSGTIKIPATVGFIRPKIILPTEFLEISDEQLLLTAIGHEMAHVRRGDFFANICFEILNVIIGFHPAVWLIRKKIAETREMAADEMVTNKLVDETAYSRSLIQISTAYVFQKRNYSLGITKGDGMKKRISRLISDTKEQNFSKIILKIALVAPIFIFIILISVAFSFNQQATTPDLIAGRWKLFIASGTNESAVYEASGDLFLQVSDGKITGKAVIPDQDQTKEFPLIEPTFDETRFSFKVDNGEELLVGTLETDAAGFSGSWFSTESQQSGSIKMSR